MTEFVLLRGVSGSNKGFRARALVRSRCEVGERWTHINVRPTHTGARGEKSAARRAAYLLAEHKMIQALRDGTSVVLTGVFAKIEGVERFLASARDAGATRRRVVFCPPVGGNHGGASRYLLHLFEHPRYEETYHEGIFDL